MSKKTGIPIFYLALDGFGTLLLVLGILGFTGIDLARPCSALYCRAARRDP